MTLALAAPSPLRDGELALLPVSTDVAALIVAASQDPEVTRWTQVPAGLTAFDARLVTAGWAMPSPTAARFTIAVPELGAVGMVTVWLDAAGDAEVGYWLLAGARGRGLASRAVRLLCDWAFDSCRLQRLHLTTLPGNVSSERVAKACGFSRAGTLLRDVKGSSKTLAVWVRDSGSGGPAEFSAS